jgi:hypothetical protein
VVMEERLLGVPDFSNNPEITKKDFRRKEEK